MPGPAPVASSRVVLFRRAGCHLCDDARALVQRVCGETGDVWAEVDVDDPAAPLTPSRREDLGELVPVVEVDGVMRGYFRIDENRLRRALAAAPRTP
ncbi:glutaredoxin family protein [Cellulomonas sp.]|uniref:glutaredoxin family protein n=1 Tax=Cellulomonas sp. TaxID=40001 RepID=UPI001AFFFCDC|nr:glutaredoxin family protein [Cellulomonas sp.]MBO9555417.1 glutaredoxin family protein [Cellulomonas sp.]